MAADAEGAASIAARAVASGRERRAAEDLRRRLAITLDHEVEILEHQFTRNSVQWVTGEARFIDPLHIEVVTETGLQRFTAPRFIIAVGTAPSLLAYCRIGWVPLVSRVT